MGNPWWAVDLDGTLAHHDGWRGIDHIGPPVRAMVKRVKRWRQAGMDIRIFTARVYVREGDGGRSLEESLRARRRIQEWCKEHLGEVLPITNVKDPDMVRLYDDRAIQVVKNTGQLVGDADG